MILAAEKAGLKEICFTDHYDSVKGKTVDEVAFRLEDYAAAYDSLESAVVKIKRGVEMGLTDFNVAEVSDVLSKRKFDFVIGSLHHVNGIDPYEKIYWDNVSVKEAYGKYLETLYECVKIHNDYDVLGHLTYVAKSPNNPTHEPLVYENYREIIDEILKEVIRRDKGIEINTSGIDRIGETLPSKRILERYKELGGRIVTLGSDAHVPENVGRHFGAAIELIRDTVGTICTFEGRIPTFHKL
jgi:histidinol-phosphatase (PHP family)